MLNVIMPSVGGAVSFEFVKKLVHFYQDNRMTLSIMSLSITISSISIKMQYLALMTLSITTFVIKCHCTQFRYAECHIFNLMPGVVMLNVIMPSVGAASLSNS